MVSVLIVDDDAHICRALTRALNAHGFESTSARGYDEAVERLENQHYDVLLTDLRMGEKDGIALLSKLRESNYRSRPILMSAYASALESQRAQELGAVRVLCKPLETRDVVEAIQRAADASTTYFGSVHGISLIDLLQVYHYGQRSLALELLGTPPSLICMRDGQIVDARHGDEQGEQALRTILRLPAGALRTKALKEFSPTVHREFQALLLDLLRELDEESRSGNTASASSAAALSFSGDPLASQVPPASSRISASSRPPIVRTVAARPEFDAACARVVSMVDRSRYCEMLDMRTGHLLGSHPKAASASPLQRHMAEWATHLYRELPKQPSNGSEATSMSPFDEMQVSTPDMFHLAKAMLPGFILVLAATDRAGGVGLAWSQLRSALVTVERDVREQLLPLLSSLT